ncbi:MAG: AAA family ATPase [Methylophilaceae bacterium]|nr:AAA family ATPase [Methylophilaceae bacterium]
MYYAHFGLKQPPFKITPNTEFFFSGGNRGAVLDALLYAITSGEGIVKVVGEVGSGKTMLCRMLETLLPETVERVYLANPSVAPEDILHAIAFELQIDLPHGADRLQVMQALQSHLIERHAQGRQVVIFVEEAQGMPLATLEEIRLLSNLETKNDKLLQIVLFGQPELDANLNEPHIRQLKERITHSFTLGPLSEHDIADYLIYRLRTAGYFGPPLFTKRAIRRIAKASKGLIRRINILADKAMLAAFAENAYSITPKHVEIAIQDSEFSTEVACWPKTRQSWWLALVALAAGLGIGLGLHGLLWQEAHKNSATALVPSVLPEQRKSAASALPQTPTTPPSAPVSASVSTTLSATAAPTASSPTITASPQPTTEPIAPATPLASPSVSEPTQALENTTDILKRRLDITRIWLTQQPPDTVTIQLMSADKLEKMHAQLERLAKIVGLENLYVYRTAVNGTPYMCILYGSYPDRATALQALDDLPQNLKMHRPRLRTVGGIREEIKFVQ